MSQVLDPDAVSHPHDLRVGVPDRLPAAVIRELSRLRPGPVWRALLVEWGVIAATIALCTLLPWSAWLYPLAVIVIGSRQVALTVLAHDAAHQRMFDHRVWNDVIGGMLAAWPTFITLGSFRHHHGEHHRHLEQPLDGNRFLWRTHKPDGTRRRDWVYPKTRAGLALKLLKVGLGLPGLRWMIGGQLTAIWFRTSWADLALRVAWTAAIAAVLTALGGWATFLWYWVVPFLTWHIVAQYVRLICEHSAIPARADGAPEPYALSRTTLARPLERWLFVPRNISYHVEHHFYPSVPFYNLPALHEALMQTPGFRAHAVVTPSLAASLRQVLVVPGSPAARPVPVDAT